MSETNGLTEQPQYVVIEASTPIELENKLIGYAQEGYRLQQFNTDNDGQYITHIAVMYLSQTQTLMEGTNIVNVDKDKNTEDGTPLIAKMISEGWRILENYSKHVALIKLGGDVEK